MPYFSPSFVFYFVSVWYETRMKACTSQPPMQCQKVNKAKKEKNTEEEKEKIDISRKMVEMKLSVI